MAVSAQKQTERDKEEKNENMLGSRWKYQIETDLDVFENVKCVLYIYETERNIIGKFYLEPSKRVSVRV